VSLMYLDSAIVGRECYVWCGCNSHCSQQVAHSEALALSILADSNSTSE